MTTEPVSAGRIPTIELRHRLRIAREAAGLEQGELAARMEVARNTVSRAESGAGTPRPIVIGAWAMATGVDRQWLETGEDTKDGPSPDGDGPESVEPPVGIEPTTFSLHVAHFPQPTRLLEPVAA